VAPLPVELVLVEPGAASKPPWTGWIAQINAPTLAMPPKTVHMRTDRSLNNYLTLSATIDFALTRSRIIRPRCRPQVIAAKGRQDG